MKVEKFVSAASIDPVHFDASYYLAPDGKGFEDVYAVLREAIESSGKVALTRVVIAQRERTIALRPKDGGLIVHSLNEQRDLNPSQVLFDGVRDVKLDPEMIALAKQFVDRQTGEYDPADLEDQYETRLRAMLDAKIRGEGVRAEATPALLDSNVIDLMSALRKSLGAQLPGTIEKPVAEPARRAGKKASSEVRTQSALRLPLKGGKSVMPARTEPATTTKAISGRKKAS